MYHRTGGSVVALLEQHFPVLVDYAFTARMEDDLDAIAQIDRLDDDFGLDTIEMGATIAVAMEAGLAQFGDAEAAIRLVKEVGHPA